MPAPLLNTEEAVEAAVLPKAGAVDVAAAAPPKIDPAVDEDPPKMDPPAVKLAELVEAEPKTEFEEVAAEDATGVMVVEPPKIEFGAVDAVTTGVAVTVDVPKMEPVAEVETGVTVVAPPMEPGAIALLPPNIESLASVVEVTEAVELVVAVAAPPKIEPPDVALFAPKKDDVEVAAALGAPVAAAPPNIEPPVVEPDPPKIDFGLSSLELVETGGFEPPPNREDDPELAGWEKIEPVEVGPLAKLNPPALEPPPNRELDVVTGASVGLNFSG